MAKFALLHDLVPEWWPTKEEASEAAKKEFRQLGEGADFVHVFEYPDFEHPVVTVCREGYAGPSAWDRIEIPVR